MFYNKISIKTKLIIGIIILILYPIMIIGYIGYRNYAKVIKQDVVSSCTQSAEELSKLLVDRIEKLNNFCYEILYDNRINEFHKQLQLQIINDSFSEYTFKQSFEKYLKSVLHSKPEFKTIIFLFSIDKKTYIVDKDFQSPSDLSIPVDSLYNHAKLYKGKPCLYYERNNDKIDNIYLTEIIYDINSLNEIGVLAYKIDKNYLFGSLKELTGSKEHNISVFTSDNMELYSSNSFDPDFENFSITKSISDKESGVQKLNINNDSVYIIHNTIHPLKWKVVISVSSNIVLKEIRTISKTVIMLCLIILPVWIILINIFYVDIIKPINSLISSMHNIRKGNFGVTVKYKRNDELGYLFKSFNRMSLKIKELINCVYKQQLATKDAQIKALQAQINPHFLYNTLETINWKAKLSGIDEISQMIRALAFITDANLNRDNKNEISLCEEIKYIDNYQFLIKKRFGDKIKFVKDIMDSTLNCIIPKLIIQPLIENAIYHGVELKKGGGTIELITKIENNFLIIKVIDNGIGIKHSVLQNINQCLNYWEEPPKNFSNSKIGVINVHKRIKLMYGDKYGLNIFSHEGEGTTVILKLPVKQSKGVKQ